MVRDLADRRVILGAAGISLAALLGLLAVRLGYAFVLLQTGTLVAVAAGVAFLLWNANPTWTLSAAVVLTSFSGWWSQMGLPGGFVAPDRFLVLGGLVAIAFRGPWMRDRPPVKMTALHWLLLVTALYATVSAVVGGGWDNQGNIFRLIEAFGILPYLAFTLAPYAFRTDEQRRVLLLALVTLGGYLGLIALFQTVGLQSLIFPHYINNPALGIHADRARGPFLEAVSNGLAMYACAAAAAIALKLWRTKLAKACALAVIVLCAAGILFALERSGWVGAALATAAVGVLLPEARRYFVPGLIGLALVVGVALATVPSLRHRVTNRASDKATVWDRKNLGRAAINMVEDRPLVGYGWGNFTANSIDHFQLGDYPLTASGLAVHNVVLGYAAELGLVGVTLWILCILSATLGAITTRGPPELRLWTVVFVAVAIDFIVVTSFVPPQVFPNLLFWTLAGVVWSGRMRDDWLPSQVPRAHT